MRVTSVVVLLALSAGPALASLDSPEIADSVGLSRSALHNRFRDTVGETPATYLTRWRVHLATRLLTEEGRSVAAAGRMVGYGTEASFSNAFVRIMGMRPGAYKRARQPVTV